LVAPAATSLISAACAACVINRPQMAAATSRAVMAGLRREGMASSSFTGCETLAMPVSGALHQPAQLL
jgi:hypothetical protein